jgi:outer membrane immunogenic protein
MRTSIYAGLLSILGIYPAIAADMAVKAPIAPLPVLSWTGCYVGANVGGGWADKTYTDPLAVPVTPANLLWHTATGVLGGGQVGCDYQVGGGWVFGFQGSGEAANLKATHLALGDFYSTSIPWLATATVRVGYALMPNLLLFGRAGGAWVRDRETKVDLVTGLLEGTANVTRSGWTAGLGAEYLITANWSVFADYNYLDFGTRRTTYVTPDIPPAFFPLDIRQHVQMVRVGFNFRFGGPGVVVARY